MSNTAAVASAPAAAAAAAAAPHDSSTTANGSAKDQQDSAAATGQTSVLVPQKGVDGSGGVGGFAAPPMSKQQPVRKEEENQDATENKDKKGGAEDASEGASETQGNTSAVSVADGGDQASAQSGEAESFDFPKAGSDFQCTIRNAVINRLIKSILPVTDQPKTYILPNCPSALAKTAEHFAMLILFMGNDMMRRNNRSKLVAGDILLALQDMGLDRLVKPLKECLQKVHPAKERKNSAPSTRTKGVNLKQLIDADYIKPGKGVISETYKGETFHGDLTEDGMIVYEDKSFPTPSSFSIFVRLKVGTHQTSSNGWQAVRYNDVKLIVYKNKLQEDNVSFTFTLGDMSENQSKIGNEDGRAATSESSSSANGSDSDDDDMSSDIEMAAAMLDGEGSDDDKDAEKDDSGKKKRDAEEDESDEGPAKKRAKRSPESED